MLQLLTNDQLSEIHASSMEVLERVGIVIEEDQALRILEGSGAIVDRDRRLARIPPYLVEEAIGKTPKSLILGARNPKFDLRIRRGSLHTRPASGYTQVLDSETGAFQEGYNERPQGRNRSDRFAREHLVRIDMHASEQRPGGTERYLCGENST